MKEFLLGIGCSLLVLMFIGWFDVKVIKHPNLMAKNGFWAYVIISSWEMMFALAGFLICLIFIK